MSSKFPMKNRIAARQFFHKLANKQKAAKTVEAPKAILGVGDVPATETESKLTAETRQLNSK